MSEYSRYRGRSVGRILHCLHTYCSCPHLDTTTVGDGKVWSGKEVFATYTWPEATDSDIPEFVFTNELWNKNQKIMQPLVLIYLPHQP